MNRRGSIGRRLGRWIAALTLAALAGAPGAREDAAEGVGGSGSAEPVSALLQAEAIARDRRLRAARARVESDPLAADSWRSRAEAALAAGHRAEALAALRSYLELADRPPARLVVETARLERLAGQADPATRRLRELVEAGTGADDHERLLALGAAYRLLARSEPAYFRAALQQLEAALRARPDAVAAQVAIGDLLLDRYNNTEALDAYRQALQAEPEYLPALFGLARSQRFDHSPQAELTLRRCLDLDPAFVDARVLLARLLIDSEHYGEAEAELRKALIVDPQSPSALSALAAVHYLREELAEFEQVLARVRELAPGYAGLYRTLAEVAGQNRRYRNAAEFAAMAVRMDDSSWRAHALLGQNRLRLGQIEAGRASMETAFRGDPYDARTKNTLDLLDRLREFSVQRSERFVLVAEPGEARVLAPRLLPIAERAFDFFSERYGHRPATPIRIEVYPRHEDFSVRTVGLVGVDIVGVSFGPVVALDSPSAGRFGPFNWASALWHEIAHSFHLSLTRSRVPRWFTEGLSVYEERQGGPGWGADVSPGFLAAFRQGRLAPASDLNRAFLRPSYPEQIPHAYFQASLLIEWMVEERGFEAVLQMLQGYARGRTTEQLWPDVLGRSAERLDRDFEAYVQTRYQASLAGLSMPPAAVAAPPGNPPPADYASLLAAARAALDEDQTARALALAEQARDRFPDHGGPGSAHDLLAEIHRARGEREAAVASLSASLAIDADHLAGFERLAGLYRELDRVDDELRVLDGALQIQPFDPALHRRLAEIHETRGHWAPAVEARAAILALAPPDPVGARYRLALALSGAGQAQAARREVLLALQSAPLYAEALELLLRVRDQIEESASRSAPPPAAAEPAPAVR